MTEAVLDNIKATGVTIFTVQVNTDGAGNRRCCSHCATDASTTSS